MIDKITNINIRQRERLRMHCKNEGLTLTGLVNKLLREYMEKNNVK